MRSLHMRSFRVHSMAVLSLVGVVSGVTPVQHEGRQSLKTRSFATHSMALRSLTARILSIAPQDLVVPSVDLTFTVQAGTVETSGSAALVLSPVLGILGVSSPQVETAGASPLDLLPVPLLCVISAVQLSHANAPTVVGRLRARPAIVPLSLGHNPTDDGTRARIDTSVENA